MALGLLAALVAGVGLAAETCTDVVHLSGRGELRGAVLDRRPDGGVTIAVRRSWLRDHASAEVDRLVAEDRRLVAAARADVIRRIERLLDAEPEEGSRRGDLLRRERDRLRDARLLALYRRRIEARLADVSCFEPIGRFTLLAQPFTPERDELTTTLKLRRAVIAQHYSAAIESMYAP